MRAHEGSPFAVQVAQCYRRFLLIEATAQGRVVRPLPSTPANAGGPSHYELSVVGSIKNATHERINCQLTGRPEADEAERPQPHEIMIQCDVCNWDESERPGRLMLVCQPN